MKLPNPKSRRVEPLTGADMQADGIITDTDVAHAKKRAFIDVPQARAAFAATPTTEGADGPIPDGET